MKLDYLTLLSETETPELRGNLSKHTHVPSQWNMTVKVLKCFHKVLVYNVSALCSAHG